MRKRKHLLKRQRWVITRTEGDSLWAWNSSVGWLEVDPTTCESLDVYAPYKATTYDGRPDVRITGYADARAVEVQQ
jgi:hypothetical protein